MDETALITNIEQDTLTNPYFRHVIHTSSLCGFQLVLMRIKPGEEIGLEHHSQEQFVRIEQGYGLAIINDLAYEISDGDIVIIPRQILHNIINNGQEDLLLYILYTPPAHPPNEIQLNPE